MGAARTFQLRAAPIYYSYLVFTTYRLSRSVLRHKPEPVVVFLQIILEFIRVIGFYDVLRPLRVLVLLVYDELQQEMRLTLSRMAQDAGTATHVETPDLHELHIEKYIKGEKCTVDYVLREGKAGHPPYISKKVSGGPYGYSSPQPMTGGRNVFGSLAVVDFQCDIDRDGLLHLRLDGENRRTKKRVTFSTAVCTAREEH